MHKRRVKYDLFIADLEQEAAAAKEALRQKGAELNGVDMEREQLSMVRSPETLRHTGICLV